MDKKVLKQLVNNIDLWDDAYYNNNESLVSDSEYDIAKDQLRKEGPSFIPKNKADEKLKIQINDALTRVGAPPPRDGKWPKVRLMVPMQSLNKVNTPEEFLAWHEKCGSNKEYVLSDKLDGLSLSLQYEKGELIQGSTRGNGEIGEDITRNAKKMKGIPNTISNGFTGFIRGEIVLKRSDWKAHFPELANPRNGASGLAKRIDGVGAEHLSFLGYTIENQDFATEIEAFDYIKSLGFETPNYFTVSAEGVIDKWNEYMATIRDTLDYDIDGQVIRINDKTVQTALGDENHRPKGAIAFKFDAAKAITKVIDIVCQTGDTGVITPVAVVEPVYLMGAKIERASLHNFDNIKELGINIGATVEITRANDVIPFISKVITPCNGSFKAPETCSICGSKSIFKGVHLFCTNKETCPAMVIGRLNKWLSELNILEWGEAVLTKLIESGKVKDVGDLYLLKVSDIAELDRMGEKSAQNLITELDKFRTITLANFIGGLSIENVATSTVQTVMDAGYNDLDAFYGAAVNDLVKIKGIGDEKASSLVNGLKENRIRIQKILDAGVSIKQKTIGSLTGASFCFTGSLSMPRPKLMQMVEAAGGKCETSVKKNLTYLVMDDPNSGSSKAQAAKKLGIKILSEEEFMEMVK
jgi:DNA ligase (NAD+)